MTPADFQTKDVLKLALTVGDRTNDGTTDVTAEVAARLPVFGIVVAPPLVVNVPVDTLVQVLGSVLPVLPPAISSAAAGILALVRGALKH